MCIKHASIDTVHNLYCRLTRRCSQTGWARQWNNLHSRMDLKFKIHDGDQDVFFHDLRSLDMGKKSLEFIDMFKKQVCTSLTIYAFIVISAIDGMLCCT